MTSRYLNQKHYPCNIIDSRLTVNGHQHRAKFKAPLDNHRNSNTTPERTSFLMDKAKGWQIAWRRRLQPPSPPTALSGSALSGNRGNVLCT